MELANFKPPRDSFETASKSLDGLEFNGVQSSYDCYRFHMSGHLSILGNY